MISIGPIAIVTTTVVLLPTSSVMIIIIVSCYVHNEDVAVVSHT